MVYFKITIWLLLGVVIQTYATKLPSYLAPCKEADPDFDTCAKASVKGALPSLIKGDESFHVPVLDPLLISEVKVRAGELNIDLVNVKLMGLKAVKELDDFHWDKDTNIVTGQVTIPFIHIESRYKISGKILVLAIQGEGDFDLKLDNVVVNVAYPIKLVDQGDGSRKVEVGNGDIKYKISKINIHMDNLFNDKALSDNMNKFLNQNAEAVIKEIGEFIEITIDTVIKSVADGVFAKVRV